MGTEYEVKLHLEDASELRAVLAWERLSALRTAPPYAFEMHTTYYDTPENDYAARRWTVRQRLENGRSVICVKTPCSDSQLRNEWETEAPTVADGLPALIAMGAPQQLRTFAAKGLVALCGARFRREAQLLRLEDGTTCELAADAGILFRDTAQLPFFELEIELKSGDPDSLRRFSHDLAAQFSLRKEPKSKYARARNL